MNNSVEQLMRTTSAMRAPQLEAARISAVRESASRKKLYGPDAAEAVEIGYPAFPAIAPLLKDPILGFAQATRLEELRHRWDHATDEREKTEVSEQIREWQSFKPERSAPAGGRR